MKHYKASVTSINRTGDVCVLVDVEAATYAKACLLAVNKAKKMMRALDKAPSLLVEIEELVE